jgi:acetyltransferase-like isoleucine patch superfamily enzyme
VRDHAFSGSPAFARPASRLGLLWRTAAPWSHRASLRSRAAIVWQQFDRCATMDQGVLLGVRAWCVNELRESSRIRLRSAAICRGLLRVERFGDGRIELGEHVYIGDDCIVSAAASVSIGAYTLVAHGVQIFDNDTHPRRADARRADWNAIMKGPAEEYESIAAAPVRIGREAWIGFNVAVMKGVTIGDRSVVAAGSVVVKDVPADSVVAGSPARVIGAIEN